MGAFYLEHKRNKFIPGCASCCVVKVKDMNETITPEFFFTGDNAVTHQYKIISI